MNGQHRGTIYLAGGFASKWQTVVQQGLPHFDFIDPSRNDIRNPQEYTRWDLDAIRRCDVVLANMEPTNPGGYALSLEVGFAKALDKKIIFIDQITDSSLSRYFEMIRQCSDKTFTTVEEAIGYMQSSDFMELLCGSR